MCKWILGRVCMYVCGGVHSDIYTRPDPLSKHAQLFYSQISVNHTSMIEHRTKAWVEWGGWRIGGGRRKGWKGIRTSPARGNGILSTDCKQMACKVSATITSRVTRPRQEWMAFRECGPLPFINRLHLSHSPPTHLLTSFLSTNLMTWD